MKFFYYLLLCVFFLQVPCIAQGQSQCSIPGKLFENNVSEEMNKKENIVESLTPTDDVDEGDGGDDEDLYDGWGSEASPEFENRLEENPNESNYGYDGNSGAE